MRSRSPRDPRSSVTPTPPRPRARLLPAALAALAILAAVTAAAADPLAVAVAVKGSVLVTSAQGGKPQKAALGRTLERGDRIQVGVGGGMTLFFSDGNVIELGEKSTLAVGGRVPASGAGPGRNGVKGEVFARVSRFVSSDSRKTGMMAIAPLRGAESGPQPMLLDPRRTSVRETRPAFRWRTVAGATRYQLTVSGDQGDLWSRETPSTSLDYPADAPALTAGGDYRCAVRAMSDTGPLVADDETFSVLPDEDAKQVTADLAGIEQATRATATPAAMYLTGSYLVGRGLYAEAAARFTELCRITPDAPGPHEALGKVYRMIGLTDEAAGEFQRALELSQAQ